MADPQRTPTRDELKAGVLVCFRNAEELLADAQFLVGGERYARAIFIACVGLEELGKAVVALELYEARSSPSLEPAVFWRLWRSHIAKAMYGDGYLALNLKVLEEAAPDLLPEGYSSWAGYEEGKRELFGQRGAALVRIKEGSLYVDFVDRGEERSGFSLPSAIWT